MCSLSHTHAHVHTHVHTHMHSPHLSLFCLILFLLWALHPTCTGSPWTPSDATTLKPPTALKASLHPTVGGGSGEESEHLLSTDLGNLMACSQDPSQAGVPSYFSDLQTKAR